MKKEEKKVLFIVNPDAVAVVADKDSLDIVDEYASNYNGGYDLMTYRDSELLVITAVSDLSITAWQNAFVEKCIADVFKTSYTYSNITDSYRVS